MLGAVSTQTAGVVLALLTAFFWAISPLCWASVGRHIGSFSILLLRGLLATVLLASVAWPAYALMMWGHVPWPTAEQARAFLASRQAMWILISGVAGMGVGDALYYEALVTLGPRRSTQILTLAPVAAVVLAWLSGEHLSGLDLVGIAVVLVATGYAVLERQRATGAETDRPTDAAFSLPPGNALAPPAGNGGAGEAVAVLPRVAAVAAAREPGQVTAKGIGFAVGGALCVGLGAVALRQAFRAGSLDLVVATVLRVGSSQCLLWLIPLFRGRALETLRPLRRGFILRRVILGTVAGPVVGMLCYVASLKYVEAGVASTLSSMSPLFILPMIAARYHTRLSWGVIVATALAAGGVGLISIG